MVAAIAWGINSHIMKKAMVNENAMRAIFIRSAFTFPILFLIAVIIYGLDSITVYFSSARIFLLVALTALLIVLGDGIFLHGLKTYEVNLLLPITSVYPLFTTLLLIISRTEDVTSQILVGTSVIVIGVALVTSGGKIEKFSPKVIIFGLSSAAAWGTSVFFVRQILAIEGTDPFALTGFRAVIMAIAGFTIYYKSSNNRLTQKNRTNQDKKNSFRLLALSGIVGWVIGAAIFFLAVQRIGAAIPTPISSTNPIVATIFGYSLGLEQIQVRQFFGILCCVLGTIIVVL